MTHKKNVFSCAALSIYLHVECGEQLLETKQIHINYSSVTTYNSYMELKFIFIKNIKRKRRISLHTVVYNRNTMDNMYDYINIHTKYWLCCLQGVQ